VIETGGLLRQTSGVPRPERESSAARERRLWPRVLRVEPLRLRRTPLLAAALCFALGEAVPKLTWPTSRPTILLLFASIAFSALTLLALRCTLRLAIFPLAALWIAAGLWAAQIQPAPTPQTALVAYADGLSRTVEGRVVRIRALPAPSASDNTADTDPDQWDQPGTPTTPIDLDLTAIEDVNPDTSRMVPIAGGIRATLLTNTASQPTTQARPQPHCGDLIQAPMRLRIPERYNDPGAWQFADYLLDQNIAATASVPAARIRTATSPSSRRSLATALQCRIFAAQTWAAARTLAYSYSTPNRHLPALLRLSPDDAGMLNAMLFGDRSRLTHQLRAGFERTGSFHLFVVSGMHLALLAGALFWLARRLHLRNWLATLFTLALASAYALLTGFGVPVQRALIMTAVFLIARLLSRDRSVLNALGAAALAVLVWSPRALFESSFQMTFLAIVAIAGIAVPLGERSFLPHARAARNLRDLWRDTALPPRLAQLRVMLRLWGDALAKLTPKSLARRARILPATLLRLLLWSAELALIGLVAETVMVLPMALYFHRATVFALPANMVSIPLVAVLASLGVATFLASLLPLGHWFATIPGSATALLLHGITAIINRVGHAQSADLRVPGPSLLPALLAVACIALCCWAVRKSRPYLWLTLAALPLTAAIVLWPEPPAVHPGQLEVTAIDVGQGDSVLVAGPTGRTMLIDAGGPTGAAANAENAANIGAAFDIGEEVVSPYLWSRHIRRLDIVVLTHAHSDHIGGMPSVLRNLRPRELWVAVDPNSAPYRALLDEAVSLGMRVRHLRAGDRITWDSIDLTVLAPTPAYTNPGPPINNDSLVMRLQFGQASSLLEGDAEAPSEHLMAAASLTGLGPPIGPDTLLKVAHHGSRTSTTPEFLALAAPQAAIISVGRQNTFGHPRPEVVARLAAAHARLFRTDRFGLTTFLLSPEGKISSLTAASNP
jgi:competence protein ComEC